MIQAIKKVVADSIVLVFSPTNLLNVMNYEWGKERMNRYLVSKYYQI